MNKSFISIPKVSGQGSYKAANAMHVILWSPNLPYHHIVWDGAQYWMFHPTAGWDSRCEYKGHTDYLRVQPSYMALFYNIPFVVRDIPVELVDTHWHEYLSAIKADK
ncbi:hypothetical protein [Neisseria elongata]|uniref:hypothetical protein n=1 Tax=Neisseria elongata TaxID=495 RepID=UPI0028D4E59B|nr:hypothetical protein [Neisseria elongata]